MAYFPGRRPLAAVVTLAVWTTMAAAARAEYPMPDPGLTGIDITGFTIPRITSFGDSYSRLNRTVRNPTTNTWVRVRNWAEQAQLDGFSGGTAGYAVSGASAANVPVYNGQVNSFAQQVQRWANNGRQLGPREATAVYFGANDVNAIDTFPTLASLQTSKTHYSEAVRRLIQSGANSGERRLFLFLIHDWGRNPAQGGDPGGVFRRRSENWNSHVRWFASQRPGQNIVTVDLYTTFKNVFANPGAYGLNNVTAVDVPRSSSTALYADPNHFGEKGQDIIEQVFLHYAARAYGYNAATAAQSRTMARIGSDIDRGLLVNAASASSQRRLGISAFTVGEVPERTDVAETPSDADPTRLGFVQTYHPDLRPDGGVGINYALGQDRSLGVVIGRYDDEVTSDLERSSDDTSVVSDTVSLYLDQKAGPLALRTRLTMAEHESTKVEHDSLIDETRQARFGGRTTEVSQRVGYPVDLAGARLLPWVELAHRTQENDGFTIDNPYISDVHYSDTEASETLAGLGIDARSAPIWLGGRTSLELYGGLAYTQSLSREDYRLTISEAAGVGADQHETIERPQLRQVTLNLGGQVAVGERLSLGAGVALAEDLDHGSEGAVTFRLGYRF